MKPAKDYLKIHLNVESEPLCKTLPSPYRPAKLTKELDLINCERCLYIMGAKGGKNGRREV